MKIVTKVWLAAGVMGLCAASAFGQFSVRGVPTIRWGQTPGSVGLTEVPGGATVRVERFEDVDLEPGLAVKWTSAAGSIGPVTVMPRVFNNATGDPFGSAFAQGAWDGAHSCVSSWGNQTYSYSASSNWGDVEFHFDPPVMAVGFSLQQADLEVQLEINGAGIGGAGALSGLSINGQRVGYVVVEATGSTPISVLKLNNTAGDGFCVDMMCYSTGVRPTVRVDGIPASMWGGPDREFGINSTGSGGGVEDFEDSTLTPGLLVGWDTPAVSGLVAPSGTLPAVFDPVLSDPFGDAFEFGVWDGAKVLINTRTNASFAYGGTLEYGDVVLRLDPPQRAIGFSLGNIQSEARLLVNGRDVGGVLALSQLAVSNQRSGYVRVAVACDAEPIREVRLNNGRTSSTGDGIVLDHVLFGDALSVSMPPLSIAVCTGETGEVGTFATGSDFVLYSWQWRLGTGPWTTVVNGLNGDGAAGPTFEATGSQSQFLSLTVQSVLPEPSASQLLAVRSVASNGCGTAVSEPAVVLIDPADMGSTGGVPGRDGVHDNNDFVVFINAFFMGDATADLGRTGGVLGPDGDFDNNDFVVFINLFFTPCPNG